MLRRVFLSSGFLSSRGLISTSTLIHPHDNEVMDILKDCMTVHNDFISVEEEEELLKEVEPILKKIRYQNDHWDNAISSYKETEKSYWKSDKNTTLVERVKRFVFSENETPLPHIHILDLEATGEIKPHIDAVRFCGNTIAGLSLLSDSVFRLVHDKRPDLVCDYLLKRRSLYVMRSTARYEFTHAILGQNESMFSGQPVIRSRRISIIFRCEPDPKNIED